MSTERTMSKYEKKDVGFAQARARELLSFDDDWGDMPPRRTSMTVARDSLALCDEVERLRAERDTPEINDFVRAVQLESLHQRERWGSDHDGGKTPADWFWLVGYLASKALHAAADGRTDKAKHHVITTAAALCNWHAALLGKTNMHPGIDTPPVEENRT